MKYKECLTYLYSLIKHGIKLGLENPRKLFALLDNPEKEFSIIHIAGTNGKGSTSCMIASQLQQLGFKVGLFTSPHMVRFTERIKINNEEISKEDVICITGKIKNIIEKYNKIRPTYFEFITAMAFMYFREKNIDWAVIETGMGGRFDATNVVLPKVSVITTIGIDHTEHLGSSIKDIAKEKASIIKNNIPVVVGPQVYEAKKIIDDIAKQRKSPIYLYGKDFFGKIKNINYNGVIFDFHTILLETPILTLKIPLIGKHQLINASVSLQTVLTAMLSDKCYDYDKDLLIRSLRKGLKKVICKGRTELVFYEYYPLLLDGAHNPEAAKVLAETISEVYLKDRYKKVILIIGIMKDKDTKGIMKPLLKIADRVIFTCPSYERAESPEVLKAQAELIDNSNSLSFFTADNIIDALNIAFKLYNDKDIIVVTGSFYTIGEVRKAFGEKTFLSDLRESK